MTPGTRRGRAHLIDPADRSTAHPIMPDTGEGMTGSLTQACRPPGTPALMSATPRPNTPPGDQPDAFSAPDIVCRTTSASRPSGR